MPKYDGYGRFEENFPGSDVTAAEWEFLQAVTQYQQRHRRRYPSWREVLHIVHSLGYRKVAPETSLPRPPLGSPVSPPSVPEESEPCPSCPDSKA